jgi:transcriptional regulator NrdR family protein
MAKALDSNSESGLKTFTDCMYFINGHCKLNDKCRYRHCREAVAQTNNCFKWPKTCRNINCPYRHPALSSSTTEKKKRKNSETSTVNSLPSQPPSIPQARQEGFISFFWDIENVPIPKAQKPFDIVQRIRQKLIVDGLREYSFTCYCNSTTISQDNQLSLHHANVRIVHVPDRKPGAVDRQIMLELDRFERAHRPPATIVLISGDIDFVGKLSDLRHQAGFHVIVIHNRPAKTELKATVNSHYSWELFTQPQQQQLLVTEASNLDSVIPDLTNRVYRINNQKNNGNLRRVDPLPNPSSTTVKPRPVPAPASATTKKQTHHCPKCTNEFESVQALRQHQEAKDHLFDCPICDESFTTLDGQSQHQKAKGHYEAEHTCLQCSRRFTKFDSLYQHQLATGHSGYVGPASPDTDKFFRGVTSPSTLPKNNQTKDNVIQDMQTLILQQGIEALVQHFPKMFPAKK